MVVVVLLEVMEVVVVMEVEEMVEAEEVERLDLTLLLSGYWDH